MTTEPVWLIVFPKGAWGASEADSALDSLMRQIALAASSDPKGEWAEKYGTNVDNPVFMMHPYCWCGRENCPWCGGCDCPESAFHYFVDGREVSYAKWAAFYRANAPRYPWGRPHTHSELAEHERQANAVNARRSQRHDPVCDYCLGKGVFATNGAEPGKGAPNFWHKPSGLRVWWYKYIGRGMVVRFRCRNGHQWKLYASDNGHAIEWEEAGDAS